MPIERISVGNGSSSRVHGLPGHRLVERIVRCVLMPSHRARATRSPFGCAARLAREVIKNDCFDRLRSELGDGFGAEVERRVSAVPGDVSRDGLGLDEEGRQALAAADIVIHSAATVSFDAPLTQAVEINLLGPSRVGRPSTDRVVRHLVAVSTAYVASTHQGEAKEELLSENRFTLDVPGRPRSARRAACVTTSKPNPANPRSSALSPSRPGRKSALPAIT